LEKVLFLLLNFVLRITALVSGLASSSSLPFSTKDSSSDVAIGPVASETDVVCVSATPEDSDCNILG